MSILVVCCTNRPNARSRLVAKAIFKFLKEKEDTAQFFDLIDLPESFFTDRSYDKDQFSDDMIEIQDRYLVPAKKFIFVVPEYNGSIAGIAKLFIDKISLRKKLATFKMKSCWLVGVADGRAGNLRGLDHLSTILLHLGAVVFPGRLPISKINSLLDEDKKELTDSDTITIIKKKLSEFIEF